jgi:hypothetical protein
MRPSPPHVAQGTVAFPPPPHALQGARPWFPHARHLTTPPEQYLQRAFFPLST